MLESGAVRWHRMSAEVVISAFTEDQVSRLTGLSRRQLTYWDALGFFKPQYASDDRRSPYARIYSFTDVVGLRTLSVLRGGHQVSLQHLREVAEKLEAYSKKPWSDLRLAVWNRKVQFIEPGDTRPRGVLDGQYVIVGLIDIINEVKREAEQLRQRDTSKVGQIEKNRYVAHNAEVIAGTRIKVSTIQHYLSAGYSPEQIMKEYPSLTKEDIETARRHGASAAA